MQTLLYYYSTPLGKKMIMAITGLIMFLYVFVHMLGNLQIYLGADLINQYGSFLHSKRAIPLLWLTRIVLIVSVLLHMLCALQLWWHNRQARPVKYAVRRYVEADYAARTMIWSGPIIALFVIYHLLHLTTHTVQPAPVVEGNLYETMIAGFKVPYVAVLYIVAVFCLAVHFYHGLWSWFQTLGLSHPKWDRTRRWLATILAVILGAGDISIPLTVLLGLVTSR
jgi:succinate dehydrogenase / fumarate reductase cytochrome b subunit